MDRKILRNLDVPLIIAVILILAFSLVIISSATHVTSGGKSSFEFVEKQALWIILGLFGFIFMIRIHYNDLEKLAKPLYVLILVPLLALFIMGKVTNGAQSWFDFGPFKFQPSELAKVIIIIAFAQFLAKREGKLNRFRDLIPCFIFVGIPMGIIILQPDLGTALVFAGIMFGMLFVAGARPSILIAIILIGLTLIVGSLYLHEKHGMPLPLEEYQVKRLTLFTNPEKEPREGGYHLLQSLYAIGSGGVFGKGLYKGTQNQLNFLPEQHTDFIFSVVGEELGFVGVSAVLLLFFIMVYRGIHIALNSKDLFGTLIATGIVSMFTFHILVNVGMAVGIMPITGIPLPLFSYGGSSMLTNMIALGLLLNIGLRRQKLMF